MEPSPTSHPAAYSALRWIGYVSLLVMVAAVLYAGWLALANWDHIGV